MICNFAYCSYALFVVVVCNIVNMHINAMLVLNAITNSYIRHFFISSISTNDMAKELSRS